MESRVRFVSVEMGVRKHGEPWRPYRESGNKKSGSLCRWIVCLPWAGSRRESPYYTQSMIDSSSRCRGRRAALSTQDSHHPNTQKTRRDLAIDSIFKQFAWRAIGRGEEKHAMCHNERAEKAVENGGVWYICVTTVRTNTRHSSHPKKPVTWNSSKHSKRLSSAMAFARGGMGSYPPSPRSEHKPNEPLSAWGSRCWEDPHTLTCLPPVVYSPLYIQHERVKVDSLFLDNGRSRIKQIHQKCLPTTHTPYHVISTSKEGGREEKEKEKEKEKEVEQGGDHVNTLPSSQWCGNRGLSSPTMALLGEQTMADGERERETDRQRWRDGERVSMRRLYQQATHDIPIEKRTNPTWTCGWRVSPSPPLPSPSPLPCGRISLLPFAHTAIGGRLMLRAVDCLRWEWWAEWEREKERKCTGRGKERPSLAFPWRHNSIYFGSGPPVTHRLPMPHSGRSEGKKKRGEDNGLGDRERSEGREDREGQERGQTGSI